MSDSNPLETGVRGQLSEKLIPSLFREIAYSGAGGLLRLTLGESMKAVFFEAGVPVFAISNQPCEQLDYILVRERVLTQDQVEAVARGLSTKQDLARALVDRRLVSQDVMRESMGRLAQEIILSVFEWDEGEYIFNAQLQATHETTLEWTAAECILQGARRSAGVESLALQILPQDAVVTQASAESMTFGCSATLTPIESFVLSRIDSPTVVSEAGTYTGLPDDEARRTVCSLVALGLLTVTGQTKQSAQKGNERAMRKLRDEIARRLHSLSSADYYEVLGVTNLATTREVETAHTTLMQRFDPALYPEPEQQDLRDRLEILVAKIDEAYEVLRDIKRRRAYDQEKMRSSLELHKRAEESQSTTAPGAPSAPIDPALTLPGGVPQPQVNNPVEAADYYYRLGRARYEQRDCYSAVELLRHAVKLDATRPHYHYFLGLALIIISQARHDAHTDGCHVTCKLGRVLVHNPRLRREAERHLLTAAELDPSSTQIRLRLGLLYKEAELPKKAEHFFREVLVLDPGNRAAQRELETAGKAEA